MQPLSTEYQSSLIGGEIRRDDRYGGDVYIGLRLPGWAATAAGKLRYVFLGVDMTSDYVFTNVSNTCNDDATLEALKKICNILGGLPR